MELWVTREWDSMAAPQRDCVLGVWWKHPDRCVQSLQREAGRMVTNSKLMVLLESYTMSV